MKVEFFNNHSFSDKFYAFVLHISQDFSNFVLEKYSERICEVKFR